MSMDDIKYGIKVELFNLGFVERNNNPFVFFFCLVIFMFGTLNAKTILLKDR